MLPVNAESFSGFAFAWGKMLTLLEDWRRAGIRREGGEQPIARLEYVGDLAQYESYSTTFAYPCCVSTRLPLSLNSSTSRVFRKKAHTGYDATATKSMLSL